MDIINNKLEELKKRSKNATESAIQINTKIEAAKEAYDKLSALAKEKYGTSDVTELKNLLNKIKADNAEKLEKFENDVIKLENEVQEKNNLIKSIQQGTI